MRPVRRPPTDHRLPTRPGHCGPEGLITQCVAKTLNASATASLLATRLDATIPNDHGVAIPLVDGSAALYAVGLASYAADLKDGRALTGSIDPHSDGSRQGLGAGSRMERFTSKVRFLAHPLTHQPNNPKERT